MKIVNFEASPYGNSFKFPDQKISDEDNVLQRLCIKCWEGINISEDEYKQFNHIISTSDGRKSWLYYLNERRIKSNFKISASGFTMISKMLQSFLDCVSESNDEYSAKMAIVLSQTFFQERSNEKIYLQSSLVNHQLWCREDMWIKMIEDGIQKEMDNYAQFCMDETSEEHKERMVAIISSQLSSYTHNMKTFQLKISIIENVIQILAEKYKIPELMTAELLN